MSSLLAGSPSALNCVTPNLEFAGMATLPLKAHEVAGPVIVHVAVVFANVSPNAPLAVTTVKTWGLVGAVSRFAVIEVSEQPADVYAMFVAATSVLGAVISVRAFVWKL